MRDLLDGQYAAAPESPGVYAVFRLAEGPPRFLARSAAARVKGQDPTIDPAVLAAAWLADEALLFLGKGASVRTRVRQLVEYGAGKPVAHAEGRALWQLADADDLVVGWRTADDVKAAEAALLEAFLARWGGKPWANRF